MPSRKPPEAPAATRAAISCEHKHQIFMHWQKHPTMAWFQMQQSAHDQLVTLRRSTAQRIKHMNEEAFVNINPSRKKARPVKFPLFGKALIEFILAKQDVVCLSDDLVLEKALRLREQLKINESELQLSNGWLSKFKERNSIRSRTLHGESGSVCETTLKAAQTQIQSIIANYSPDDVFNFDESALFYRLPPNKTLAAVQLRGRKKVKTRLTIALCSNASGSEKMKMLVIGSAKSPRCFKGIAVAKKVVEYFASPMAWVNTTIFNKWLRKFNLLMHGRRALLLLDNASSRKAMCECKNVEVVFFPPTMTSRTQPLDADVYLSV